MSKVKEFDLNQAIKDFFGEGHKYLTTEKFSEFLKSKPDSREAKERRWVEESMRFEANLSGGRKIWQRVWLTLQQITARTGTLNTGRVMEILNDLRHEGRLDVRRQSDSVSFTLTEEVMKELKS